MFNLCTINIFTILHFLDYKPIKFSMQFLSASIGNKKRSRYLQFISKQIVISIIIILYFFRKLLKIIFILFLLIFKEFFDISSR